MSIRVAIVGTEGSARGQHFPSLAALGDRVVIVAVTDTDPASARSAADEFGVPAVYDDLPGLLAAERPDVVVLATPPIAHRAQAIAALDAGAWVISEKPPTLSLAEYDEIAEHEGENGPFVSYILQHRFGSARDAAARADPRRRARARARRPVQHAVVPSARVPRRTVAREVADRGRRADDGARHPPDGPAPVAPR